jgi:hypothetical protein
MAKGKVADKKPAAAKGKGAKEDKKEVKGAQSINVRHILVRVFLLLLYPHLISCPAKERPPTIRVPPLNPSVLLEAEVGIETSSAE